MASPSLETRLSRFLSFVDPPIARIAAALGSEKGTIRGICFHAVRRQGPPSNRLPAGIQTPLDDLKRFVEALLAAGYVFITPGDILKGLRPDAKYIMVTFDDGYFSTSYAVETFKSYGLRLTLYVSPYFLCHNIGFPSDIIYREVSSRHPGFAADIHLDSRKIRHTPQGERERFIVANFGRSALTPVGDEDRPMSIAELKDLYALGNVEVGNHTMTHAALTALSEAESRKELVDAQDVLHSALGVRPISVAYPYGYYNEAVSRVAAGCGFRFGLTVEQKKHGIRDLGGEGFQHIGRFGVWNKVSLERQLMKVRTGTVPSDRLARRLAAWARTVADR